MTVREALEKLVYHYDGWRDRDLDAIAPKIEAALRAAYLRGAKDERQILRENNRHSDNGVTAGIEAMR